MITLDWPHRNNELTRRSKNIAVWKPGSKLNGRPKSK